ncbi:MAG: DedA family protein [Candidatus Koribacter versatilis]|uniref:DedA family protein n=1 Tax=Candidatus Korobacter versatilis TaxID=658062 RepID=A0A932A8E7_9BACT|nr:DedA family protein [Candidatus Koribacter versatilis]
MVEQLFDLLRQFFDQYGYWTLVVVLLLENAGLPVPGETTLLFASFLAYSERELHLGYIILFGIIACTIGDNLGYIVGYRGGRPLLLRYQRFFHIRQRTITRGERLFDRYGAVGIFFARFLFGLRIIAGPMAGVLRMPWKRFVLFNFLGATVWVTTIATLGYFFGSQWGRLVHYLKGAQLLLLAAFLLGVVTFLRRRSIRRARRERRRAGRVVSSPHSR